MLSLHRLVVAALLAVGLQGSARSGNSVDDRAPTYSHDISKIIDVHCLGCHRQGGVAGRVPFSTYEAVRHKASDIREKIASGEMPPWTADPAHSLPMSNDARLSAREVSTFLAWIDAGAPEGNPSEVPPHPVFSGGWLHPQGRPPDAVVSLPQVAVSANGTVPYILQLIKVPFSQDKWISALQVRAGNPVLLHHMGITEVGLPEGMTPKDLDAMDKVAGQIGAPSSRLRVQQIEVTDPTNPGAYDMLGVYTPGTTFESYGAGGAKMLKGGPNLYLNFNMHYTTTGREETDRTQLALWFEPDRPDHILYRAPAAVDSIIANGRELLSDDPGTKAEGTAYALPTIAANQAHYELIGLTAYPSAITIFQLQPHAHVRAVDFKYLVVYPDGRRQVILTVPHYSYHFQLEYVLATPLVLPAGSKLVVVSHYDNSSSNDHLRNLGTNDAARRCGPENVAIFGQQNQSWDEMFSPLIQYSPAKPGGARLGLVTAVGCLVHHGSPDKAAESWELRHGSATQPTRTQGTSSAELAVTGAVPLGAHRYGLLGPEFFDPARHVGHKVVVKGVLIPDSRGDRINVTSLQSTDFDCPE